MRENMGLYRGKEKPNGEWVEGYLLRPNPEVCRASEVYECVIGYQVSFMEGYRFYEVDPETVGQFTGMTDKNGKKIFEGDIVEYYPDGMVRIPQIGRVEFHDGAFGVMLFEKKGIFLSFAADYCTVIGNIHDNPELLEVSK